MFAMKPWGRIWFNGETMNFDHAVPAIGAVKPSLITGRLAVLDPVASTAARRRSRRR